MYKRDLITAEIQKLSQALARLLGLQKEGKEDDALDGLQEVLENDFGILYADLLAAGRDDFTAYLEDKNFPSEKLDMLSQFLYLRFNPAVKNEENDALAEKLALIYQWLEVKFKVVSMTNLSRQSAVLNYLKSQLKG